MLPLLLLAGGALLYFLSAMDVPGATEALVEETAAQRAERERLIAKRKQNAIEATAYTNAKVNLFNSLSPEERKNYKGGF